MIFIQAAPRSRLALNDTTQEPSPSGGPLILMGVNQAAYKAVKSCWQGVAIGMAQLLENKQNVGVNSNILQHLWVSMLMKLEDICALSTQTFYHAITTSVEVKDFIKDIDRRSSDRSYNAFRFKSASRISSLDSRHLRV
ncbi:hypothetical protein DSL72_005202 [Monilinia vaccinii-corymbosi]|uniref:Uncharacterized protein n=1 Tax=Monilinia vaccinii-corymbosi TaxID=61207 RepID=A0A8A3PF06_9HELO|nr:hypothetical protein DSL72_005202 [Monilinia vaccinii-corymbosi]